LRELIDRLSDLFGAILSEENKQLLRREFGTDTDVEFLGAAVRGGLVQLPLSRVRLDFFGGRRFPEQ